MGLRHDGDLLIVEALQRGPPPVPSGAGRGHAAELLLRFPA